MAKIQYLIIHCTDTPAGREITAADIRYWHTSPPPKGRGWKQVGYTDMIHLDGRVERLVANNEDGIVDPWEITNGVAGINYLAQHIVYVGGGSGKDTRTPAQHEALKKYVLDFVKRFPGTKVKGHNEFAKKACPCFDVQTWLKSIGL